MIDAAEVGFAKGLRLLGTPLSQKATSPGSKCRSTNCRVLLAGDPLHIFRRFALGFKFVTLDLEGFRSGESQFLDSARYVDFESAVTTGTQTPLTSPPSQERTDDGTCLGQPVGAAKP